MTSLGPIQGYTPNLGLKLVNFNWITWHDYEHDNWAVVDALINAIYAVQGLVGLWDNGLTIAVPERYIDSVDGTVWEAATGHTSAVSGTFSADRAANPTFWTAIVQGQAVYKGVWANDIAYVAGDYVSTNDYRFLIANTTHTSGSSPDTIDTDIANWDTLIDLSATVTAVELSETNSAASAAAAAADAISTAADAVSTAADVSATGIDAIATAADAISTAADASATAIDAIATAADAVSTAADAAATAIDASATAADVVLTGLDVAATNADVVITNADVVLADAAVVAAQAAQAAAEASIPMSDSEVETAYNNQVGAMSQATAEAGTSTTIERVTAQRISQAIAALVVPGVLPSRLTTKTASYTMTAPDMLGITTYVPININTTGSVDITELALASMTGTVVYYIETDNGDTSSRKARLMATGATEVWTGYQKGDFIMCHYNGTDRHIINEKCTLIWETALTADVSFTTGQTKKIFDVSISVIKNHGAHWSSGTFDFTVPPFTGRYLWLPNLLTMVNIRPALRIDTVYYIDTITIKELYDGTNEIVLNSGEVIDFYADNSHNNTQLILGDAGLDESRMILRLIERIR